jgi:hypothetical protein
LAGTLAHGWRASVELFRQAWSLARAGAGWLLVLVILALAIRHLPATMHPLQELMGGLPVNMRRILSWLPLAGFLAAGWVVLGWVILFATVARWKSPAERWGGLLAGLFLALAPVDALIAGGFLDIDSRTGSLGTLVSALDGQEQAEDTLLAGAVSHARRGNTAQAIHGLKLSEAGSSKLGWYQDLRGWLFLQNGDLGAREILEDAWRQGRNPWTGLALGKTVDTTLELRRQLESGQGIGLPEPTPMQFAGLFVHSMGGVSAQAVWMPRGIVALPILGGIGVLLLAVLIALSMASMRNAGGIEPCVVCGHTTCPRCRKSALCARCQAKLAQAETADARRQMRLELVAHRVKVRRDFGIFADTVLPGWGGLVTSTGPAWGTLIILVVTCGVLGIGAHSILWTGDVEGAPVLALRLLGCLPAALWVGLVMPVRRVLTARRNG